MESVYRIRNKKTGKYFLNNTWSWDSVNGTHFKTKFTKSGKLFLSKTSADITIRRFIKKPPQGIDISDLELVEYRIDENASMPIIEGTKEHLLNKTLIGMEPRDIVVLKKKGVLERKGK